jgi:hypothetical protein
MPLARLLFQEASAAGGIAPVISFRYLLLRMSDDPTLAAGPSEGPTKQDLDQVFGKIRLQVDDLLWSHRIPQTQATALLREAALALAHRWNRVRNREQWLLDRIEKAVRRAVNPSPKEPRDAEDGK